MLFISVYFLDKSPYKYRQNDRQLFIFAYILDELTPRLYVKQNGLMFASFITDWNIIKGTYMKKAMLVLSLSALCLQNVWAVSSIRPELLNKVLKKEFQITPEKNESKSSFDTTILSSPYASWGVSPTNSASINLLDAWKQFKKKKDIVVAVIDTGIDFKHPFLTNNIFVTKGKVSDDNYGMDFSIDRKSVTAPTDMHGHGTHVAGIIKSIYPEVKIMALKYYSPSSSGQANLNATIEALKYAIDNNVDIINYSGGGAEPAIEELRLMKEAEAKGILVVAAAGNEESNIDIKEKAYYPASYGLKNIISVSAHDESLQMLSAANWGKNSVDIVAPGYKIRSSLNNGRAGFLTGTSQATAFVTGVAALLKSEFPNLSSEKIKDIIRNSAHKEKTMENKCISGGRLDATQALKLAAEMSEPKNTDKRKLAQSEQSQKKEGKIIYRLAN